MKKFVVGVLLGALLGAATISLATPRSKAPDFAAELAAIEKKYNERYFLMFAKEASGLNESTTYTLRLISRQLNRVIELLEADPALAADS